MTNTMNLDWSTVGYTATEAALIKGSLADALLVAVRIAAELHPVEGQVVESAAATVRPVRA